MCPRRRPLCDPQATQRQGAVLPEVTRAAHRASALDHPRRCRVCGSDPAQCRGAVLPAVVHGEYWALVLKPACPDRPQPSDPGPAPCQDAGDPSHPIRLRSCGPPPLVATRSAAAPPRRNEDRTFDRMARTQSREVCSPRQPVCMPDALSVMPTTARKRSSRSSSVGRRLCGAKFSTGSMHIVDRTCERYGCPAKRSAQASGDPQNAPVSPTPRK